MYFQNYDLKNNFQNKISNINLKFDIADKLKIDLLNYKKDGFNTAQIFLDITTQKDFINLKELKYTEDKN